MRWHAGLRQWDMQSKAVWLGLAAAMLAQGGSVRQPVLVELFTSEGCSSCPPADALLERLDREQPVEGAQIIVLSEHVDYWNHLGWADPFSSPAFSARQEAYARRFGLGGPYTPEMIVDGMTEFVGSDARRAEAAIRSASQERKVAIRIEPSATHDALSIGIDALPAGKNQRAAVFVAQAADSASSDVLRGENRGHKLHHISIVKSIQQIGTFGTGAPFHARIPLSGTPPRSRVMVFAQEPGNGRIWGAALYVVPD